MTGVNVMTLHTLNTDGGATHALAFLPAQPPPAFAYLPACAADGDAGQCLLRYRRRYLRAHRRTANLHCAALPPHTTIFHDTGLHAYHALTAASVVAG